jgi:hypothetical protein
LGQAVLLITKVIPQNLAPLPLLAVVKVVEQAALVEMAALVVAVELIQITRLAMETHLVLLLHRAVMEERGRVFPVVVVVLVAGQGLPPEIAQLPEVMVGLALLLLYQVRLFLMQVEEVAVVVAIPGQLPEQGVLAVEGMDAMAVLQPEKTATLLLVAVVAVRGKLLELEQEIRAAQAAQESFSLNTRQNLIIKSSNPLAHGLLLLA